MTILPTCTLVVFAAMDYSRKRACLEIRRERTAYLRTISAIKPLRTATEVRADAVDALATVGAFVETTVVDVRLAAKAFVAE